MNVFDRVFSLLALLAFAGFLGILIFFVPRPGLVIVCVICIVLCGIDFLRSATARRPRHERSNRSSI
jgi:hypothetical protein